MWVQTISERLFESLPAEERPSWHPHNYEILSGQLVGPGLPAAAEKALLKKLPPVKGATKAAIGIADHEIARVHRHAAHRHRRQSRHRRQGARAAHLDVDGLQRRFGFLGRELVRKTPPGRASDEAHG